MFWGLLVKCLILGFRTVFLSFSTQNHAESFGNFPKKSKFGIRNVRNWAKSRHLGYGAVGRAVGSDWGGCVCGLETSCRLFVISHCGSMARANMEGTQNEIRDKLFDVL